jgi:thiamine-phosphate pyrophosphorylase
MPEPNARLYLMTPLTDDAEGFAPRLAEACAAGDVAAVLIRLAGADERTLVNRVKALAPAAQERGAAALVSVDGEADLGAIAVRGGADGVHVTNDLNQVRMLRERFKADRAIGVGGLRSKDDAMAIGEAGVDYLLFGEPRRDGGVPPLDAVIERAAWWAEIFETPCVAFAPSLEAVAQLAATGAEFVALGDAVWTHPQGSTAAVRTAQDALVSTLKTSA